MEEYTCPFSTPLVTRQFGCAQAQVAERVKDVQALVAEASFRFSDEIPCAPNVEDITASNHVHGAGVETAISPVHGPIDL